MKKTFSNFAKRIACLTVTSLVLTVTSLTPLANSMPSILDNSITAYAASDRLFNQWSTPWDDVVYPDGATLYDAGCGIFSTANAVYSLNGSQMDPQAMADYTYAQGVWGDAGVLLRDSFFDKLSSKYGATYGFQITEKVWGNVTNTKLIDHLKNGGVAVAHVSGHFIAIDGYRTSDGYFHVLESAVNPNTRNLSASGWVSSSKLQTGKTAVDYFALISKRTTAKLTIKLSSYPRSINAGSSYNLAGSISSGNTITMFKSDILQNSKVVQTYSYNPNTKNINISSSPVNTNMRFNTLSAGSYVLRYIAKDASGATATWSCNFTVKSISSTLAIRPSSYPTTINKGSSFNLTGTISSNYNVTMFKGEILSSSSVKQTYTVYPNSKSVSIGSSAVNTNLRFNQLPAGTYTLKYTAKDSIGKTATWSKSFQVKSTSSSLTISPSSYPTTITKGSSFNLTGSVSSNYKITLFQGQILQGSTVKQSYSTAPNTTSVNIKSSAVNTNMRFGSLARGSYTLKYIAKDSYGKTITWSRSFTVK